MRFLLESTQQNDQPAIVEEAEDPEIIASELDTYFKQSVTQVFQISRWDTLCGLDNLEHSHYFLSDLLILSFEEVIEIISIRLYISPFHISS